MFKRVSKAAFCMFFLVTLGFLHAGPEEVLSYYNRGYNHAAKKEYDNAIENFTQALRLDPNFFPAYVQRGQSYSRSGDYEKALADFNTALRLTPDSFEAYYFRGMAYYRKNDYDRAIADFTQSIRLNPNNAGTYYTRSVMYNLKGEMEKGIEDLTQAIRIKPDIIYYFERALVYGKIKEHDKAIADYTRVIGLDPNSVDAYNERGLEFRDKGEYKSALEDFNYAIRLDPNSAEFYFNRANVHSDLKDYDRAIADLGQVIRLKPNDNFAYNNRGIAYMDKGEYDHALEDFNRALGIEPNYASAYHNRGETYRKKGNYDRAIEDYTQALRVNPNFSLPYNSRGNAYREKGDNSRALADFTQAIRIDPVYAEAYQNRGIVYGISGDKEKAIADFSQAIRINPNFSETYSNRGAVYRGTGEFEKALADFNQALRLNPGNGDIYRNRGLLYSEQGQTERAIADFTQEIRLNTEREGAYIARAREYEKQKETGKAIADYSQAIKINPNAPLAYQGRGRLNILYNNMDQGFEDLGKFLAVLDSVINFNEALDFSWMFADSIYASYPYLERDKTNPYVTRYIDMSRQGVSLGIRKAELLRSGLGSRSSELTSRRLYLYYAGVDLESHFGNGEAAFIYSESLRSRGFLEQLGTEAALRLPGITANERRSIQELIERRDIRQTVLNNYSEKNLELDAKYAEAGLQLTEAENRLTALDAEIGKRIPRYAELRNPKPVDIAKAKAYCGDDRVVLEYVLWDNSIDYNGKNRPSINSYCLVLSKNGVTPVQLDPSFDYLKSINDLRSQIINDENRSRGLSVITPSDQGQFESTLNVLYDKLIKPVLPRIPANIKNIVIVPDGPLMYLPFDVLRENKDKPEFGETYRLSLSPSVSVSVLAAKTGVRRNEPLLAFGGAVYDRNSASSDRGNRGYVSAGNGRGITVEGNAYDGGAGQYYTDRIRWLNLPGTEAEVRGLLSLTSAQGRSAIFTGRDVSEAKVKELSGSGTLRNYPVIHFACHGYFNEEVPAMSSIVFSEVSGFVNTAEDGYLTIPEIALLNMDARMVVLSACETGLAQVKRGDGMVGLARSFLVAGAENVGVSLWSISDTATVEFMSRLYRGVIQQGMSFRDAYYVVRNEFRHDPKWSHPYYWAAFTLYE
ncbi:tetratricopeptide repeat protein [Treponema primitia]|uniref:CHAT domain-containing protein n=1 Tax=Treponema primitia TaxID=88058 RepID=UPI003980449D